MAVVIRSCSLDVAAANVLKLKVVLVQGAVLHCLHVRFDLFLVEGFLALLGGPFLDIILLKYNTYQRHLCLGHQLPLPELPLCAVVGAVGARNF